MAWLIVRPSGGHRPVARTALVLRLALLGALVLVASCAAATGSTGFGPLSVVTVRHARAGRLLLPVSSQVLHVVIDVSVADEETRKVKALEGRLGAPRQESQVQGVPKRDRHKRGAGVRAMIDGAVDARWAKTGGIRTASYHERRASPSLAGALGRRD